MDSTRWQRVQSLFHEAADLPEDEQRGFLETRCGDDVALVSEILILLQEDARGGSLLDRDVAQVAHQILDDLSSASAPFKEFGPYRIKKALGEGGMGIVYLADREDLGSQVAIKVLRDAWLSPVRRERFVSEQRTLAQLVHPSIARLYDADTSPDGTPFFVMEYVEGVPLTDFCKKHNSSASTRLRLFRAVCEAVLYAHQHAVIHRDLKPSNIFVKEDGTIRLLDFGISKHLETVGEAVDQTVTSLRLMTPVYAAPEQIRGEQVGIQTDVYSLGVILYELLAGCLPFDLSNRTPAQAEKVLTEKEAEKPSTVARKKAALGKQDGNAVLAGKTAWADLDVLCLTAMHKDAQRRYQSVEALVRDIDHYLKGEPLEGRPDTLSYRFGKFVRRNHRAVAAAGVFTVVVLTLVVFFTVRLAIARNTALAEAARAQRIQKFMTNLFQGGDPAAGPSDSLRVVTLLDRGVQEAQSLSADRVVQAELYETLGTLYQKLGRFDQAGSLLRSAIDERKSLFGADSPEVAEGLVALGVLRSDQAHLDEAEQVIRHGMEMQRRHLPPNHPAVARSMVALGRVLAQRGSYDAAIQTLSEAVRIDSTQGEGAAPSDLATSLTALAEAQYSAGHYEISDSLYRRVLGMDRQLHGPRHPLVANDLGNLGSIQQDLGYYTEAERFAREALDITESYYGKEHPRTANNLTMLGRALLYQKKYDEAEAALQQALAIQEKVFGPVHPEVADTLNELGNVASMRDNFDEAERRFRRVASIYREVYGDHHYLVAIALSNVAYGYLNKKDYARAEQLFRDVVRRFTETLSADNVNTGIARIKLGRTLLRQNRFNEAEEETMAGYQVLAKQTNPSNSFLQAARKDLAAEYEALNRPEIAAKFRAELAAEQNKPPAPASEH
jgi:serine/threonine protein kinase/tetratricopeptide (TPR) repeat protein